MTFEFALIFFTLAGVWVVFDVFVLNFSLDAHEIRLAESIIETSEPTANFEHVFEFDFDEFESWFEHEQVWFEAENGDQVIWFAGLDSFMVKKQGDKPVYVFPLTEWTGYFYPTAIEADTQVQGLKSTIKENHLEAYEIVTNQIEELA